MEASTLVVPSGSVFLVKPVSFAGPSCEPNIVFQVIYHITLYKLNFIKFSHSISRLRTILQFVARKHSTLKSTKAAYESMANVIFLRDLFLSSSH